jgi:hypothetical protein
MESSQLHGGCACGAIRFHLASAPYDTGWCHCRLCQHISGSAGMVFTTVPIADLVVDQGADRLGRFRSTSFGEREFCRDCGAPLTIHVAHQPDEIDIAVGALDMPGAVSPGFHLYVDEVPSWMTLADGLPCYPALRPTTRGLDAGRVDG